jgi:hypothetical protein
MKKLLVTMFGITFGVALSLAAFDLGTNLAHADSGVAVGSAVVPVGSGFGSDIPVALVPSSALPNPATDPMAAITEERLARKTGWPLAVFAGLAMLGKALAYGRDKLQNVPILGPAAKWLSIGKRVMVVAAIGGVGSAGYDVLVGGGTLTAALYAGVISIAGAAHSTVQASFFTARSSQPGPSSDTKAG